MTWIIDGVEINNRLLLGTAGYPSPQQLKSAIETAGVDIITIALRRETAGKLAMSQQQEGENRFWSLIQSTGCRLLPNTAGCRTVQEAITTAHMARELFNTHWLKLEVIGDDYTLQPDVLKLVETAKILIKEGFFILPYCTDDLIVCRRLVDVGCQILMPWAAPIGSGQGIINPNALKILRQRLPNTQLIIDAGIGAPSHAMTAMEMGYDGILVNTAVALARDPVAMADAFRQAVKAGHTAYKAGLMPPREFATPSTPVLGQPFRESEPTINDEH